MAHSHLINTTQLISKQLVGILIVILVRKSVRTRITDVSTSSAGIGILNTLGNKGGAALRIRIDDTVLCFVNCHLQAYDDMTEKRNSDYRELTRRLFFATAEPQHNINAPVPTSLFDCDALFWLVNFDAFSFRAHSS